MKISIITVTYNSEEFISMCIRSVLSQSYQNFEYIIIDGNSKDKTIDIVKQYPQIKYISEPDNGIYDAINKGIKMATGDVVGVLNSDDYYTDNNVLTKIAAAFNADTKIEAVYADIAFVSRTDISIVKRYYSSSNFKPAMFRLGYQPAHPSFYCKRYLFEKYGYYRTDLKIAGDFELMLRYLLVYKIEYKYIKGILVKMRIGGVSTSGLNSLIKLNQEILLALSANKIRSNYVLIYMKYLVKWWGFVFKKK